MCFDFESTVTDEPTIPISFFTFSFYSQPLDHCQMSIRQLKAKGMGRYELLQWLNKFLETDYSKVRVTHQQTF